MALRVARGSVDLAATRPCRTFVCLACASRGWPGSIPKASNDLRSGQGVRTPTAVLGLRRGARSGELRRGLCASITLLHSSCCFASVPQNPKHPILIDPDRCTRKFSLSKAEPRGHKRFLQFLCRFRREFRDAAFRGRLGQPLPLATRMHPPRPCTHHGAYLRRRTCVPNYTYT